MPTSPSVFQFSQIAVTAAIAFVSSMVALWLLGRRSKTFALSEASVIAIAVGFSVLVWRMAGNVARLNDDPIPLVSPNDVLCPLVTYVVLGLYAALHPPADMANWEKTRAWLTVVSFVVNVLFI